MMLRTGALAATLTLLLAASASAQTHFDSCAAGTGSNATVLVDPAIGPTVNGGPLASGDEIAVFSPQGLCAGVATWSGSVVAITVWADDPFTSEVDGMAGGEEMNYVVWDASSSSELGNGSGSVSVSFDPTPPYRTDATFLPDAIYRLASLAAIPNNVAPSASFTLTTSSGAAPLAVSFDGSASNDSDGTIASYAWSFGTGATATTVAPSYTFTTPGSYDVTLTVTDDDGATDVATATVTVQSPSNSAPVAQFSATPVSGAAPLVVAVDGSASSDSDGTISAYAWDFGDGATATGVSSSHTYTASGAYTLRLTVTDDDGATNSTTRQIQVNPPANIAPTAAFTVTPSSGPAPVAVSVNAASSSDSDGTITSYAWTFGDGGTASGVNASHTYTAAGSYTVRLTVTDDDGASASTTRQVQVTAPLNQAPNASFSATPSSGTAPLTVALDATSSSDSDGSVVAYAWNFGDGQTATGSTTSHTFTGVGTYAVLLTVTDDDGATDVATRTVTVSSPSNAPPTAAFTVTPQAGSVPLLVNVNGSTSSDSDGTLASYAWDYGDGATGSGVNGSHTYNAIGTYTLRLTVTDDDGASGSTTRQVVVTAAPNLPPNASFSLTPASGDAPLPVSVDATGSSDSDGSIASYAWSFGDGQSATGATATHTYTGVGTFTIRLTVTDDDGATSEATRSVNVTSTANVAPTASFSASATNGIAPLAISFDASGSMDGDGSIASYAWDFADGTSGSGVSTTHTFTSPGTYVVELTVTDDDGALASASRTITVSRPPAAGGLVLHYPFNETSGTSVEDISGRSHDGVAAGGATWDPSGVFAGAIQFNGNGARVTVADHVDLNDLVLTDRTVSVWFRVDNRFEAGRKQVVLELGGNTRGLNVYVFDGLLYVAGWNTPVEESGWSGSFMATGGVRSGEWHHVAVVLSGSSTIAAGAIRGFLDGVQFGAREGSQIWPHTDDSGIGAVVQSTLFHDGASTSGANNSLSGSIDDLRIYNEALTTAQIAALYEESGELQNQAPTARMVVSPPGGQAPATITFDATTSTDPDNNIQVYRWAFGDGGTATGAVVTHAYTSPGVYTATLTVEDSGGSSSVTTQSITITPPSPSNQAPTARFTVLEVSDDLFARRVDASTSSDPDGIVDQYIWDFGDGTAGRDVATTHVFPGAGVYVVKLTVVDNDGATSTQQTSVEIKQNLPLALEVASVGDVGTSGTVVFADSLWTIDAPGGATDDPRVDAFQYVHRLVSGDDEMAVRVDSIENTDRWAFAGLMFRDELAPAAPHVAMTITPESGPVFAYRLVDGGWEIKSQTAMVKAPVWLRIVRTDDLFEGQYSIDGVFWTSVGKQRVAMGSAVHAGIVASSNTSDQHATAILGGLEFGPRAAAIEASATHDLSDAFPNPFSEAATFSLSLSQPENVYIAAYDVLGRRVAVLHDDMLVAESLHSFTLDGERLAGGLYLIQVYGESFRDVRKVTLVK